MTVAGKSFENIVEKEENPSNQHFLLFQHCFIPSQTQIPSYLANLTKVFQVQEEIILYPLEVDA